MGLSGHLCLAPSTSKDKGIILVRLFVRRSALKATVSVFGSAKSENCLDVTCDEEELKWSRSDARSRPGRARKLSGCSRGSARCNQAPSCQLLTPHAARCSPFHTEEKPREAHPHPTSPPPARVCGRACGLFFSPFAILSKLTATQSQPLGTAVGSISKTGQSLYPNPQPHTLALALRCGECNLLSLCLTHNHPSITDTAGATIDTVCKHHCLAAATLNRPPKDETEKEGVKHIRSKSRKTLLSMMREAGNDT